MRRQPLAVAALVALAVPAGGESRGGRIVRIDHPRSDMVLVPAGTFLMGFPDLPEAWSEAQAACERELGDLLAEWLCAPPVATSKNQPLFGDALPSRQVYLPAYAIDRYEVTVRSFRRCVAAGRCDVAPLTAGDQRYTEAELPVVNVTWQDASDYCAFVDKRLPTEAEWERAARGTDGRRWPWGDQDRDGDFNHGKMQPAAVLMTRWAPSPSTPFKELIADDSDGAAYLAPPGSEPWNQSPVGAFDMAGNVAEWVADFYSPNGYGDLPPISPVRLSRESGLGQRVVRGGSWIDPPYQGRTYTRGAVPRPDVRMPTIGFRCARDVRAR